MEEEVNPQPTESPDPAGSPDEIREKIIEVLKGCYDPEIPVDIYELGLIYDIDVAESRTVEVKMTLTSPMCPVAESLPPEVESKIRAIPEVASATVTVVWDPPWSMEKMSEAAKLELGML
jgi:FeS assembly SUF system protein